MDLSSPLRTIAPSLDSAVLEVLAGTESGLSATRIARLSRRGTRAGQWPVLNRLVEHGLVVAEPANTGFLYRLNRDHVLAPVVLSAVRARTEVFTRLGSAVSQLMPAPVHASVFGSFARREADEHSDIDLLVVVLDDVDLRDETWLDQMHQLSAEVLTWTGNRLEPLVYSRSRLLEIVQSGEPIVTSWRQDGVTIHGQALGELMNPLRTRSGQSRRRHEPASTAGAAP